MKKQRKSIKELKKYWQSDEFVKTTFGKNANFTDDKVEKLISKLLSLPNEDWITILAYGSLMSESDGYRTIPSAKNYRCVNIDGYDRVFNIGSERYGSFLNVRVNEDAKQMIVMAIDVHAEDMPKFLQRESLYEFTSHKFIDDDYNHKIGLIVVSYYNEDWLEPQLNYLHLCLSGIQEFAGIEGVDNFLDTSYCYNPRKVRQTTIREWLYDMNPIDYMIRHKYSSR